jgi:peptidoglycan/xylan/chitin deacetylase (PgdA/CDA1 family)
LIKYLKKVAKYAFAVILYYSGILAVAEFCKRVIRGRTSPLILMYHRVLNDSDETGHLQPGLYVTKGVFDRQIAFMADKYSMISITEYLELLQGNCSMPPKAAIVTFDDGWRDNYLQAYPVLKKYNTPAVIFLAVDFIGADASFWFLELSKILASTKMPKAKIADKLRNTLKKYPDSKSAAELLKQDIESFAGNNDTLIEKIKPLEQEIIDDFISTLKSDYRYTPLDEKALLSWNEVFEMAADRIEFGSHGLTHRLLTSLKPEEVEQELKQSKILIEDKLKVSVLSFSYPNGNYNHGIEKIVKNAGYRCAFLAGKNNATYKDKFAIGRIGIHNDISIGLNGRFSEAMFALHLFRNN